MKKIFIILFLIFSSCDDNPTDSSSNPISFKLQDLNTSSLTYNQLVKWKIKFHELRMGKPSYDLFIDDKNLNANYHWQIENIEKNVDPALREFVHLSQCYSCLDILSVESIQAICSGTVKALKDLGL